VILCEYSRRSTSLRFRAGLLHYSKAGACLRNVGVVPLHFRPRMLFLQFRCANVTPEGVLRPAKCKARATRAGT
jgi:hypothetical protein